MTEVHTRDQVEADMRETLGLVPSFFGTSPQGFGTSPFSTSPLWVRGIRVHASSNKKEILVGQLPGEGRVFVKGSLTDEGSKCQALQSQSGELYTLVGDLKDFKVGDTVYVLGTIVPVSFCMQGTTIAIDWISKHAPRCS